MDEKREREIWFAAERFRESCRTDRYGIIDLFRECAYHEEFRLIRYPLGDVGCLGFSLKRDSDVVIFMNSSVRLAREIFTLAHEIGHVVLHFGKETSSGEDYMPIFEDDKTISGKSDDQKEREANMFAAFLLMPKNAVNDFFEFELAGLTGKDISAYDVAKIMSAFRVSFEMVLNRLENLGRIHLKDRIRLENERNETRVGNLLRTVGGGRLNLVSKEISIPSEYLDYAIYNYNHNAVPMETLEKVLGYYELTKDDIADKLVSVAEEDEDLDELIGRMED